MPTDKISVFPCVVVQHNLTAKLNYFTKLLILAFDLICTFLYKLPEFRDGVGGWGALVLLFLLRTFFVQFTTYEFVRISHLVKNTYEFQ